MRSCTSSEMQGPTLSSRRSAAILAAAALALLPWAVLLNLILPSRHVARHWDIAWTGFDVALACAFLAVAVGVWQERPWLVPVAATAGAMLVCDAWFDILTADTRTEVIVAVVLAICAELPLAALCFWLALRDRR